MEPAYLQWSEIQIPWWTKLSFGGKWDYAKREFDRILKQRDPEQVTTAWQEYGVDTTLLEDVSILIADTCFWPNTLFLPGDDCGILFWNNDGLAGVEAAMQIEDQFLNGRYLPDTMYLSKYGPLIDDITQRRNTKANQ